MKSRSSPTTLAVRGLFAVLLLTTVKAADAGLAPSDPETWKTLGGETRTSGQAESLLSLMKIPEVEEFERMMKKYDRLFNDPDRTREHIAMLVGSGGMSL
jgi:hypothetical protein